MENKKNLKDAIELILKQLPNDSEIDKWIRSHGYYGHCTQEYYEGLEEGVNWMKQQIEKVLNRLKLQ